MSAPTTFPPSFTFGAGTSAYQIEGGRTDGKGESVWDRFAHTSPTMTDTGDVANDHYHRWREDVALMADLGLDAYRLSIAWTRVLPDGDGEVEERGLAFYSDLVDELLAHDITPWVTLYHWDLPQALEDRGGWTDRGTVDAFVRYAEVVTDALGDRVRHWITHNEPWVAAMLGYKDGLFAPGRTGWDSGLAAAHHILLSHGRAVPAIRERVADARVGLALDCRPSRPASDDPADVAAHHHFDGFRNRWFLDAVAGRGYPQDVLDTYRDRGRFDGALPDVVRDGDLETIGVDTDFLGINYYTSITIAAGHDEEDDFGEAPVGNAPEGVTEMGWPITPDAFRDFLVRLHEEYAPPEIVVTENGASFSDGPDGAGRIHDARRIAYLHDHLTAVAAARDRGAPVTGYFVWSLMDNLEWTHGFGQRFGIVWVDFETQERIVKDSARWYADVIGARRVLDAAPRWPQDDRT